MYQQPNPAIMSKRRPVCTIFPVMHVILIPVKADMLKGLFARKVFRAFSAVLLYLMCLTVCVILWQPLLFPYDDLGNNFHLLCRQKQCILYCRNFFWGDILFFSCM